MAALITTDRRLWYLQIFEKLFMCLIYLFVYAPLVVLVVFSFNSSVSPTQWVGFSWQWYETFFQSAAMLSAFRDSLIVASVATIFSVGLGLGLVLSGRWWYPRYLTSIFVFNVVLPEIVIAICVLMFFIFMKIPTGYLSLIAGHTLLGVGITIPMFKAAFWELDPLITEASLDLGATYWQTLRFILVPLISSVMWAAAFLVFTLSLDDFFISFFCSGSELQTISTYIYNAMRCGANPSLNVLSVFLIIISLVFIIISGCFNFLEKVFSKD